MGRISHPALAGEQLRQLDALHREAAKGSIDRLHLEAQQGHSPLGIRHARQDLGRRRVQERHRARRVRSADRLRARLIVSPQLAHHSGFVAVGVAGRGINDFALAPRLRLEFLMLLLLDPFADQFPQQFADWLCLFGRDLRDGGLQCRRNAESDDLGVGIAAGPGHAVLA